MAHRPLLLTAFLLAPFGAFAQPPAPLPSLPAEQPPQTAPGSATPTLKVKTRLTVEDVTVTDAKDQPVHGLLQPDFTVKEDGKIQTIKNFEEYDSSEATKAAPPKLSPGTYSNRQAATPNAFNILLLDNVTTDTVNLAIERQQAIKYLKTLPEGTQVAIMKMEDDGEVSVVQGFTSDRNVLLAAIDSVKPEPLLHLGCETLNRMSQITTAALTGVTGFVSGIKGRKNLIWFTPGIPWLTNYGLFIHVTCLRDYTSQLQNAYGLLRAARVAVYPLSPEGLQSCIQGADNIVPCSQDSLQLGHDSMWDFARNTGGKAYYDRNDLDMAIGEAIANGSDYYSLSYVPPLPKYDGKYHTISVNVDRPGLNLLYREGYTGLDAVQPQTGKKNSSNIIAQSSDQPIGQFHAAMEYGPVGSDLKFEVHVQPSAAGSSATLKESINPKLKGQPLTRYDFEYVVPAGEITLPSDNPSSTEIASAQLAVAVFSSDGVLLNAAGRTVVFPVKSDQAAQFLHNASRVTVQVDLPPGKVFVRAGILDVASQKWGTLEIPDAASVK